MKTVLFTLLASFFLSINANSQITKRNWMLGGNAYYSTHKSERYDGNEEYSDLWIAIEPSIGYFIADNIAIGGKLEMYFTNASKSFIISPFARYYFRKPNNTLNFFTEGNIGYGYAFPDSTDNYSKFKYGLKAGPVVFLTPNIGLELSLDYYHLDADSGSDFWTGKSENIRVGFGLQVHLENNK